MNIDSKDFNPLKTRGWGMHDRPYLLSEFTAWDDERQKWYHTWRERKTDLTPFDFFLQENERTDGFYMILRCLDATNHQRGSEVHKQLNIYCDPFIDKYIGVGPHWKPDGWINPIFREGSYAEQYGVTASNPKKDFVFQDNYVIFSGTPYFFIEHTNLTDLNKKINFLETENRAVKDLAPYEVCEDLENWYIRQNPHFCARTLGELFRLIIDWDLAYHHFENREVMGILCHNILGTINMPPDLYDLIYKEFPESVVARYLRGDTDAINLGDRQESPVELLEWCKEKYWDLRHKHIDEVPNVDVCDDNHYCNRIFI